MTDRTTNLILKAQVDQSAAEEGVRALRDIQTASEAAKKSFLAINENAAKASDEFKRLDEASKALSRDLAINDLASQYAELAKAGVDAEDQLGRLQKALTDVGASSEEIDKATEAFKRMSQAETEAAGGADSGGGFGGVTGLRRTGSALNQLGLSEIGRPVQLLGDLGQVVKEVGVASEAAGISVTALEASLGPIAAVAAAAALALAVYDSAMQDHKKEVDSGIATLDAYYGAIAKGTTESLDNALKEAKLKQDLNKQELADIQQRIDDERQQQIALKGLQGGVTAGLAAIPGGVGLIPGVASKVTDAVEGTVDPALSDLKKKADELQKSIQDGKDTITAYNKALGASQVATNDAAEAEKRLETARAQAADKAIAQAVQDEQLRQTGSSKGVEAQLNDIDTERAAIMQQLLNSDGLSNDKIKELNTRLGDLADRTNDLTNNVLPAIKAREAEEQAAKDATKAFDEFTKSMNELGKVTAEIAKLEADRARQVAQEQADDARNAQRAAVEKDYQARIDAAKREEAEQAERDKVAQADADALTKFNDDKAKIVANEFDGELKAYQNYIDAEKRQTDQANRQRLQTLESAQNDLKNLAAAGDVAGFVQRSDQAKLDLKHQAESADDQQKQLYDNYQKQVQAARDAETKQLNDLQATFDREKKARDDAAAARIQQIEDSGKEANTKSAQLERELNDIREQWRRDDLQRQRDQEEHSYDERLQIQQDKQREILAQTGSFFDQWINDIAKQAQAVLQQAEQATPADNTTMTPADIQAAQTASAYLNSIDSGDQTFATGLDYVPRNNYRASLDLGERVLTAQQNRDYTNGGGGRGGGDTYHVSVQNTVGDVATMSALDEYQQVTISGIKQALKQAKGKGSN